jgi:hypothetical protein
MFRSPIEQRRRIASVVQPVVVPVKLKSAGGNTRPRSGASGGGTDPLRASTSLLLVPGADGSAIVDQSPTPKTLTLVGAPTVSGGYIDMSGAGQAITVASAQQVLQGATAWCAEALVLWPANQAATQTPITIGGMDLEMYRTSANALGAWRGVALAIDSNTVANSVLHHFAIDYTPAIGTARIFFNGVYVGGWTGAGLNYVAPAGAFYVGSYNGTSEYVRAKLKGLRVTKASRYPGTTAFTPPTSFPTA